MPVIGQLNDSQIHFSTCVFIELYEQYCSAMSVTISMSLFMWVEDPFSLVLLPGGKQVVGGRWVFALKQDDKEARYVAKVQGVDYFETFSPTTNLTSLHLLMQLAAQYNLKLHQMDVKARYLHAPIDCEVYMEQPCKPQGFPEGAEGEGKMVW